VLTALTVGARIGSGITAELGSMKVTEQLDAIKALGADPIKKLVVPRVIACTLVLPVAVGVGRRVRAGGRLAGGPTTSTKFRSINSTGRWSRPASFEDFFSGIAKAAVFGLIIAVVGCYKGFQTGGGTEGWGGRRPRRWRSRRWRSACRDFFSHQAPAGPVKVEAHQTLIEFKGLQKAFGRSASTTGSTSPFARARTSPSSAGPGTGKSVLLKCLIGLLYPDRGSVMFEGEDIVTLREEDLLKVLAQGGDGVSGLGVVRLAERGREHRLPVARAVPRDGAERDRRARLAAACSAGEPSGHREHAPV